MRKLQNKRFLKCLVLSFFILSFGGFIPFTAPVHAHQDNRPQIQPQQSYAKWGRVAIETVKKKYPDSKLSDYEYLGTNSTNANEWQDNFHIIVSKDGTKKLIRATVSYDPKAWQLKSVNIKEEAL